MPRLRTFSGRRRLNLREGCSSRARCSTAGEIKRQCVLYLQAMEKELNERFNLEAERIRSGSIGGEA